MTLATSAKDVRFYKWPNISYIGIYESPTDCMSIKSISWSNDGKELLAVKSKGFPVIIDVPVRTEQHTEVFECTYISHASVGVFSNQNPNIVAFGTEQGYIFIYNRRHTRRPQECLRVQKPIQNLEFSHDDQFLVAGCVNGPIILYNHSYKPSASFLIPNGPTLSTLAYNKLAPNLLAAGSKDGILALWNTDTTDNVFTSKQHTARITDITFFENGLSTVGIDGRFISYDLRSYQTNCCELDCSLSSLAYLNGTYELAVSTTSGQLRSYDLRYLKSPLRTLLASKNSIKKISFPLHPDITGYSNRPEIKKYDENFSASGDFSIASCSSPRHSHLDGKHFKLVSEIPIENNSSNIPDCTSSPQKYSSSVDFDEVNKIVEEKLQIAIKDFEDKIIQSFYRLRISTSKQFISLEEKISQNWNNFVDYLKFSGQEIAACQSGDGVQKHMENIDDAENSTQTLNIE